MPTSMHPDAQLKTGLKNGFDPKVLYKDYLTTVEGPIRGILESHSKIPMDKVVSHVNQVRDSAFAVFPYACIGQFSFVQLSITASPYYPEILQRAQTGHKLLDLGCAFGQELRQLMFDGVPPENLYGSDIQQDFLDLGYDLFLDRTSLPKSQLIAADILDKQSALFTRLSGKLNIVYISLFLHVFDFDKQVTVAENVLDLLAAEPGSLIVCRVTACRDRLVRRISGLGNQRAVQQKTSGRRSPKHLLETGHRGSEHLSPSGQRKLSISSGVQDDRVW